uniref:Uncharacterized protein n=1 Tax=Cacopsylla melanoneura TaxID=428564 RepID=A0A8D8ZCT7_9HEMI
MTPVMQLPFWPYSLSLPLSPLRPSPSFFLVPLNTFSSRAFFFSSRRVVPFYYYDVVFEYPKTITITVRFSPKRQRNLRAFSPSSSVFCLLLLFRVISTVAICGKMSILSLQDSILNYFISKTRKKIPQGESPPPYKLLFLVIFAGIFHVSTTQSLL